MDWIPSAFTKPPSCSVGHALHFLVRLPSASLASRPAPTSRRAPHIRVCTRACTFQPILFNSHPCTFCLKCSSPDSLPLLVPGSILAPVTSSRQPSLTYSGSLPQHHTHPTIKICTIGASLVAQWLRICLLMQGTRVRALVWEDPTCRGATRPVSHNY